MPAGADPADRQRRPCLLVDVCHQSLPRQVYRPGGARPVQHISARSLRPAGAGQGCQPGLPALFGTAPAANDPEPSVKNSIETPQS
jgi:hypothetical protein